MGSVWVSVGHPRVCRDGSGAWDENPDVTEIHRHGMIVWEEYFE